MPRRDFLMEPSDHIFERTRIDRNQTGILDLSGRLAARSIGDPSHLPTALRPIGVRAMGRREISLADAAAPIDSIDPDAPHPTQADQDLGLVGGNPGKMEMLRGRGYPGAQDSASAQGRALLGMEQQLHRPRTNLVDFTKVHWEFTHFLGGKSCYHFENTNMSSKPTVDPSISKALAARWNEDRAWAWHRALPWLVGCNFIPSSAVNQLEMWQADTFDAKRIGRELGWLSAIGMNSVRVFLHDLAWEADPSGFLNRLDRLLGLAHRQGIGVMPVFFDSVWHPFPRPGRQQEPEPGVHNSCWLQSPGVAVLKDPRKFARLKSYLTEVIGHFRDDARIHLWDLWNEPDNANGGSYGPRDLPREQKAKIVLPLLAKAFLWARAARPVQPLTSGVWMGDWSSDEKLDPLHRLQLLASDVVSFHRYAPLKEMRPLVGQLRRFGRPLLCAEFMARGVGSTFQAILPHLKKEGIAAYSWGSIAGKSQTIYPWDSWQNPYPPEPPLWFHDILRNDGTPYDRKEIEVIRRLARRPSS